MNPLVRDKAKLKDALERAEKTGDFKMAMWCKKWLKYYEKVKG